MQSNSMLILNSNTYRMPLGPSAQIPRAAFSKPELQSRANQKQAYNADNYECFTFYMSLFLGLLTYYWTEFVLQNAFETSVKVFLHSYTFNLSHSALEEWFIRKKWRSAKFANNFKYINVHIEELLPRIGCQFLTVPYYR